MTNCKSVTLIIFSLLWLALPLSPTKADFNANETVFTYTGDVQQWVVPDGITSISVDVRGAQGGIASDYWSSIGGPGGPGGRVQTTLAVTPGETLFIYVGGAGSGSDGGFNGGGNGGYGGGMGGYGGGGGGASDIKRAGSTLTNRIVIASGGGGGKGYYSSDVSGPYGGGLGGGLIGGDGPDHVDASNGGKGSTQNYGGAGGTKGTSTYGQAGEPGTIGQGGTGGRYNASGVGGGGGGGGYYGGGGGASDGSGGGGGSSYSIGTDTIYTQGFQIGDGIVIITREIPTRNYLTIDVEGQGYTNPEKGTHSIITNEQLTITATPIAGYEFSYWSGNDSLGDPPTITIKMDEDKAIIAHFVKLQSPVKLFTNVDPPEGGFVDVIPEPPDKLFKIGTDVVLIARENKGYKFQFWVGSHVSGRDKVVKIKMDQEQSAVAVFEELPTSPWWDSWIWLIIGLIIGLLGGIPGYFALRSRLTKRT